MYTGREREILLFIAPYENSPRAINIPVQPLEI
jgi:hypothetical protein